MSGVNLDGQSYRKGAADSVRAYVGGKFSTEIDAAVTAISSKGGTPLVVATKEKALGVIYLKDIVKGGLADRFERFRAMGIKTVMITGDNPLTAAAIAKEAGVDDFLAQATPEDKLAYIRREQTGGRLVAMTGDGTNDAPALAQADVGVAMNTGTQAAKEAGNMVDLDSNPTKLIEVVEIGKQLLMTRGALTTFSIANDVAKYFAIIPAMLLLAFPAIAPLNVMHLASPNSAILSAVIFNALVIIALIPLALRGVQFRALGADVAAAAQPAHLRAGRHHRALHRHQGHRPRRVRPAPRLKPLIPHSSITYEHMKTSDLTQRRPALTQAPDPDRPRRRRLPQRPGKAIPSWRKPSLPSSPRWCSAVVVSGLYPLLVWGLGQGLFHHKANGSLIVAADGKTVLGSELLGQNFGGKTVLQPPPVRGRGRRVRSHRFQRHQLWARPATSSSTASTRRTPPATRSTIRLTSTASRISSPLTARPTG